MGGGGKGIRVRRGNGRLQSVIEDTVSVRSASQPKCCPCVTVLLKSDKWGQEGVETHARSIRRR